MIWVEIIFAIANIILAILVGGIHVRLTAIEKRVRSNYNLLQDVATLTEEVHRAGP